MVKVRNAIEALFKLVRNQDMRPTFQAARKTAERSLEELIVWAPSGPQSRRNRQHIVELDSQNETIKQTYMHALSQLSGGNEDQREICASPDEMWSCIQDRIGKIAAEPLASSGSSYGIPVGFRNQHCEGKLLRYVIQHNLLGKVFPYIGCSKLCCEPCFTAIRAMNQLLSNRGTPQKQFFVVDGTHRKIYSGFGITPIDSTSGISTPALVKMFNGFLCRDIGIMAKLKEEKGLGGSDSDP